MQYLTADELNQLADLSIQSGLDGVRQLLFPSPEMVQVRARLPTFPLPLAQIKSDLGSINGIRRTPSGIIPLERWLSNAIPFISDEQNKGVFDAALDKITAVADGAPAVSDTALSDEIKEEIVLTDDLIPFGFLGSGDQAGLAVGRLKVFPYINGEKHLTSSKHSPHLGTAWLLTDDLIMTNHHVANARSKINRADPLPIAEDDDLKLQGQNAKIEWDYLVEDVEPDAAKVESIVAWDVDLDYAIFKLAQPSDRVPLRVVADDIAVASLKDGVPVNIIQHPMGGVKMLGIRNNLVLKTTDQEVHYFTDTRRGSSGSPVMNDSWQVIGLHKSARRVEGVRYQGKSTAFINIGTRIRKIIEHANANFQVAAGL